MTDDTGREPAAPAPATVKPSTGWSGADIHRAARAAAGHAAELLRLVESGQLHKSRDAAVRTARRCALAADRAAGAIGLYDGSAVPAAEQAGPVESGGLEQGQAG